MNRRKLSISMPNIAKQIRTNRVCPLVVRSMMYIAEVRRIADVCQVIVRELFHERFFRKFVRRVRDVMTPAIDEHQNYKGDHRSPDEKPYIYLVIHTTLLFHINYNKTNKLKQNNYFGAQKNE